MSFARSDYYVYVLFDAAAVPRYVGKGRRNRTVSTKKLTARNYMKNAFIADTLRVLGDIPLVKVRENMTEKEAFKIEIAMIAAIGRRGNGTGPLTNVSPGGDGLTSEGAKELAASFTPEKRRSINKAISAAHLKYSPQERRDRALKREKDRGEEERKASGRKGSYTRMANSTPEQRRQSALKASLSVTKVFWITDGIEDRRINQNDILPPGWRHGRQNICADTVKVSCVNTKWINDGKCVRRLKPQEPLPAGWVYGRKPSNASSIVAQIKSSDAESPTTAPSTLPSGIRAT